MSRSHALFRCTALALAASTLMACGNKDLFTAPLTVVPDTFVLTSSNKLIGFAASAPGKTTTVMLAVPATETLLGGDFRPADGLLYIVTRETAGNALKVYTADTGTGALGAAIPLLSNGMGAGVGTTAAGDAITLVGAKVGVDFNPVANALRIVDSDGVNLRTTLGAGNNTFIDAAIPAGIAESAYTNSFAATCQTDLYHVNATQLLLSAVPNGVATSAGAGGRLVGSLGVTAEANAGFDIRTSATGTRNVLTAALKVGGTYGLYTVDDQTGAASSAGAIGGIGSDSVLGLVTTLPVTAPANGPGNALAITAGATQSLLSFNRPPQGSPARLCSSTPITGLASGDVIVGADTRPATGALTALAKNGTVGTLYTVTADGVATPVATLASGGSPVALTGSSFGVDFNPVPDRLRVVGDDGQNLRVNVADGATTVDTSLSSTGVSAAAYTNSIFDGGTVLTTQSTTLYGIDSTTDSLVLIGANPATGGGCVTNPSATPPTTADAGNPNCGVVSSVGVLGVDAGPGNGLEIEPRTGTALMVATVGANTTLYTVNLATGAATAAGNFAAPIVALTGNGALTATVFGVTPTGKLVSFLPDNPAVVTAIGTLNVPAGETVQGIDFRPSIGPKNGTLVALTTAAGGAAKLYVVNPADATATVLSGLAANAADSSAPYTAVAGAAFGIDFNPVPDALRTVSNTQENLRSNPDSGATFTDGNLSASGVYAAGYTNSFSSTGSTALFYLRDAVSGNTSLHSTTAPNDGVLTTVGTDLGFDFSTVGDIDIAGGQNGFVLGALQLDGATASGLYRISLASGVASKVGADIATAGGEPLVGIAIQLK